MRDGIRSAQRLALRREKDGRVSIGCNQTNTIYDTSEFREARHRLGGGDLKLGRVSV
jgi:hypothetical protein